MNRSHLFAVVAAALLHFPASTLVTAQQPAPKLDPAEKSRRDAVKADREKAAKEAPARPHGRAAALEDLRKMTVADGLEVTLFASEPQIVNPANMDIDARGRVWITEGANYRSTFKQWGFLRPGGDRIMVLEDTNGDGVADKETVFYQGDDVNAALGICVLGSRIIVSCSPKILVFTDANGDLKADGPPQILFNGIGGLQHDHGAHAFVFGPDGKLYFNHGDAGGGVKQADGKTPVKDLAGNEVNQSGKPYRKGMVFRCNLDGSQIETLGWNFRNNYEVAVDSFGTLWQSDNDDDGNFSVRINFVMEFGNYGYTDELTGAGWKTVWDKANQKSKLPDSLKPIYHWFQNDPGVVPNLLVTGAGSPTGLIVYEGKLLPEVFRNQMIHCDPGPRTVRAYPVEKAGAGYTARMVDILTSTDSWYRPADVCVAPDGSLLIADWSDGGVGGHNMVDRKLETMTGRVYRVAPKGQKYTAPSLNLSTPAGAVAALQSPNHEIRYLAWAAVHQMQGKAEPELLKLWNGSDARQRARALHLLARVKGSEAKYVAAAVKDKDADLRITGLRIARELRHDVLPLVKQLARDPSAAVRRECAIALRHHASPEAPKLWAQLAQQHDGRDRWYLEALGIAADRQEDKFFSAWLAAVGDQWNTPAGRDVIWRARSTKAPALIAKIATDKTTSAADRERFLRALDFVPRCKEKDDALAEIALGGL